MLPEYVGIPFDSLTYSEALRCIDYAELWDILTPRIGDSSPALSFSCLSVICKYDPVKCQIPTQVTYWGLVKGRLPADRKK